MVRSQKSETRTKDIQNAQLRRKVSAAPLERERRPVPLAGQASPKPSPNPNPNPGPDPNPSPIPNPNPNPNPVPLAGQASPAAERPPINRMQVLTGV